MTRIIVDLNGSVIGELTKQKEISKGKEFILPDGTSLMVKSRLVRMSADIEVIKDGVPLPNPTLDPKKRIKDAKNVLYFLGVVNVILGLLAELLFITDLLNLGVGWISAFIGIIYIILGFKARKGSAKALLTGTLILGLDTIISLVLLTEYLSPGFFILRIILLYLLFDGYKAYKIEKTTP